MSEPVTLGFGDGTLAGVVRSDAGGLVCRSGETRPAHRPRVRALGGAGGWQASSEDPRVRALGGWQASSEDGLDVVFEPLGEPARFADGTREWLCRARGTAGGGPVDCLGHAVVEAGPPRGWKRVALGRVVAAWLEDDLAIALRGRRPARARNHEAEALDGFVLRGSPPEPHPIDDPRLSTAYAGDGRQRRAGLELWETEESEYPMRLAGEAIGEGELELEGGMRMRTAFFVWHHAGRVGSGRYDIVLAAG